MSTKNYFKMSLLFVAIVGLTFSPVSLYAQLAWSAPTKGITLSIQSDQHSTEETPAPANAGFSSCLSHFEKPESIVGATGSRDGWMKWCDDNVDAIGTGEPADFIVAARFLPSDLTEAGITNGSKLTKVKFIPWYTDGITFTIQIYQDGTSPTKPGNIVHQQVVTQSLITREYNEVTLTTPVVINTSQELWMAYRLQITKNNQYPAGCDAGPRVVGKGDLMYWGGWCNLYESGGGISVNWNIEGYIEAGENSGIETIEADVVKIYPNPTTEELTIENGQLTIENVDIFDIYGRKVSSHHLITSSSHQKINISHLPSGIYFIRIQTETGIITSKVVKQ